MAKNAEVEISAKYLILFGSPGRIRTSDQPVNRKILGVLAAIRCDKPLQHAHKLGPFHRHNSHASTIRELRAIAPKRVRAYLLGTRTGWSHFGVPIRT